MFGRRKKTAMTGDDGVGGGGMEDEAKVAAPIRSNSDRTLTNNDDFTPTKAQIKRATRTRFYWALASSFLLLISVVFLILVEIGDTKVSSIRNRIYFIKIDVSDIIPVSVPNAVLINSIAQSLGLHDFYTVGLWNFCEGYNGQGTTSCSTPQTLYWFNPVRIIQSELLAGATIALPAEINDILDLIRLVSEWMFGLFLAGACLDFVLIFIVPLSIFSRWASLPVALLTFLGALLTTVATVIATVMFIIMQNAITSATQLNIKANIGVEMFAFMWVAAACSIVAWLIQTGMCCCCASRRDVRTGRKRGSKKAWGAESVGVNEKPRRRLPTFGRTRRD